MVIFLAYFFIFAEKYPRICLEKHKKRLQFGEDLVTIYWNRLAQDKIGLARIFLQIVSWDDIPSFLYPVLSYLGPYIASQHTVAVKLLRLLTKFFDEEKEKAVKNSRGGIFLMANARF